ncbi:MAG TPA: hypothetical protein VIX91_06950 [Candidatus Acidoferrum sp.]
MISLLDHIHPQSSNLMTYEVRPRRAAAMRFGGKAIFFSSGDKHPNDGMSTRMAA